MNDVLTSIFSNIPALAIVGGFVIGLVSIVGRWAYSMRRDALAAELKREMLDRGMSAEEIKTVLEAGPKP